MLNHTGDGIFCDYCGSPETGDFMYYSFDFKLNKVMNKFKKEYEQTLTADVCQNCMALFSERLKQVSEIFEESERRCDVTAEDMGLQDHNYYKCYVSKAHVSLIGQPHKCIKCGEFREPNQGPCEDCEEGTQLYKQASVEVDEHFVVLNFSPRIYEEFKSHLETVKRIGENEWIKSSQ